MATITLRPDVYDKAAIFARKDKLNIEDWVNKILQKIVVDISEKEDMKAPAESKNVQLGRNGRHVRFR